MKFALVGNQNCGKTTLFNCLTGSNQHVGNFPGVTVAQKSGKIRGHKDITVVDLPGIYSIRPYSGEEILTLDFLLNQKPDGIINIADATNIERNLYLTLQLIEMQIPMILVLNMMDELTSNGGSVDVKKMSEILGIPVVPISAVKNEGISEVVDKIIQTAQEKEIPPKIDFCPEGPVHRCIHAVTHIIEDHAQRLGVSPRFAATKLIEGDSDFAELLGLGENEKELIEHSVLEMEHDRGLDRHAALADMRYNFVEELAAQTVTKKEISKEQMRSKRIDAVLTHKYFALPIFFGLMFLIFWLTFDVLGAALQDLLGGGITLLTDKVGAGLAALGISPVVHSLVVNGVFGGVGSVLSFLPIIIVLFFFLSILEDAGYMARVAFVMDKLLRKIGLSGRSIVPMLLGFGCTVPAVMATRTLNSERDRKMTVLLVPFMSCSAKIPIYAVFTDAFFEKHKALVMIGLYVGGILTGIVTALLMKATAFRGKPIPFVMELPNYRMPSPKTVALLLWEKAKDFLQKAFTVIFVATLVIWFLQTFSPKFFVVTDSSESILAYLGRLLAPVFSPLGFNDWRIATSLVAGLTAKEAVISTLGVLTGAGTENILSSLTNLFTPLSALSFLVFTLLYTPCFAAIAAIKREMNSRLVTAAIVAAQCVIAWVAAFGVYKLAGLFL
ncbi:MAG: ferrous iron transport protein B [Acutalibacteraceae bacterium]|jgi:ferrous iron transport protein B